MSTFIINRSRNAKENLNKVALKGKVKKTSFGCEVFFCIPGIHVLCSKLLKFA